VAFLENFPGDIADKTGDRYKKKFAFVHCAELALPKPRVAMLRINGRIGVTKL
jgi:hypothetical protein